MSDQVNGGLSLNGNGAQIIGWRGRACLVIRLKQAVLIELRIIAPAAC